MTPKPESEFPTIIHARDALDEMVKRGLGSLPVQILIVPDSTLVALAMDAAGEKVGRAVKMIEVSAEGRDMGLLVASLDGLNGGLRTWHGVQ